MEEASNSDGMFPEERRFVVTTGWVAKIIFDFAIGDDVCEII